MTIRTMMAAGALALAAGTASAATMLVEVTGTVSGVEDGGASSVFGGAVTTGSSFTLSYSYDLDAGYSDSAPDPNGAPQQYFYSGSGYGTPTAATATFSSGTFSTTVSGDSAGTAALIDSDDASVAQDFAAYRLEDFETIDGLQTVSWAYFDVYDALLGLPDDFDMSYSITADATNQMFGSLFLFSYDEATQTALTYGYLSLTGQQVTVTAFPDTPSPVPLPASGALLLVAAGGLAALRRRA